MIDKIANLITNTFESQYFVDSGSLKTETILTEQIEGFNMEYPNVIAHILRQLRNSFPKAQIENWTQFFNLDRCIRFLVQFDEEERYVYQLSIYGFFSVYHSPYSLCDGKYTYGEKKFINPLEFEVGDKMYECAKVLKEEPVWLEKETLNQIVFDLSIPQIGHKYVIALADVLFTTHYI